jgi:hypothetical protein
MRLLTHNQIACIRKGCTDNFPLKLEASKVDQVFFFFLAFFFLFFPLLLLANFFFISFPPVFLLMPRSNPNTAEPSFYTFSPESIMLLFTVLRLRFV